MGHGKFNLLFIFCVRSFPDDYRRRVFFNYEKRIRIQSPPEKVFEYFASIHTVDGEIFMTPSDLMRAIVPVFPPSESNRVREGFLRGERRVHGELYCVPSKFFMLFDTNNDGLISFAEYKAQPFSLLNLILNLKLNEHFQVHLFCYTSKHTRVKLFSGIQNV